MLKLLFALIVFSIATYLLVRAFQQRSLTGGRPDASSRPSRPVRRHTPPRVVAPDDDEDFLRDLDRKRLNPPDSEG